MSQSTTTRTTAGSGGSDDGIAATTTKSVPVLIPTLASDSPAATVPWTKNNGDIDTVTGPHILASSDAAVVLGSISGPRPPSPPTIATAEKEQEEATEELINEENNKRVPTHEDRVLLNHVVAETRTAAADVLMRTPIDSNNNNNSTSDSDRKKDETMDAAAALLGEGKVATFSNNGSPAIGHAAAATTARRRVTGQKESLEKEEAPKTDEAAAAAADGEGSCSNNKEKAAAAAAAMMLQDWNEMPRYLQFNPYVLTGYRPLQNISECFASLFYFHNETFNILTHGIPIVYILATVPSKLMWDDYRFLSWCHIVGAVAPWCGSFLYHLFMNVNRGETVYYTLLKLDMLGIWISQSFGALPMVTATVHCLNWPLKWLLIVVYSLMSIWGLYKAMCATSPWQRRLCFSLPFTMRILLTMIRLTRFGGGNTTSMTHIFLQDAVSVAGGAIGAMHIPEKWFPGSMDYYLNSHNIMHVLVVLAVYSMHQATVQDLDWMSKAECLMGTTIPIQEASITSPNSEL